MEGSERRDPNGGIQTEASEQRMSPSRGIRVEGSELKDPSGRIRAEGSERRDQSVGN